MKIYHVLHAVQIEAKILTGLEYFNSKLYHPMATLGPGDHLFAESPYGHIHKDTSDIYVMIDATEDERRRLHAVGYKMINLIN